MRALLLLAGGAVAGGAGWWLAGSYEGGAPGAPAAQLAACGPTPAESPYPGMVFVPAASFAMGSDSTFPEEGPATQQSVAGFWMDRTEVTNAQFAEFVAATGYRTLAERGVRLAPALDSPVVAGSTPASAHSVLSRRSGTCPLK